MTKYKVHFKPQEDITAYELARAMTYIGAAPMTMEERDQMPSSVNRHFMFEEFDMEAWARKVRQAVKNL